MQIERRRRSRKLVVVDFENVLFGRHEGLSRTFIDETREKIVSLAEARRPIDQFLVGCNPQLAFAARDAFPTAQLITRTGTNGADRALVEHLDAIHAAARFTELCIVSGDHEFAGLARDARLAGLVVRVVAPSHGLSTALRLQATASVLLPAPLDFDRDQFESSQKIAA
jgi:hypothetical protein